jgi:hypothetical protein
MRVKHATQKQFGAGVDEFHHHCAKLRSAAQSPKRKIADGIASLATAAAFNSPQDQLVKFIGRIS